jgi:type I restriction enzyme M protein
VVQDVAIEVGAGPHADFNRLFESLESAAEKRGVHMTAKRQKLLMTALGSKDPNAAPVIKKIGKPKAGAAAERDALYGAYHQTLGAKPIVVEYEPDSDLRDTEQVPFLEDGGIEAFFRREVLPHTPDAWIDEPKTIVGYEISFTRQFYKPQPLRTLEEIDADIRALEKETGGLLEDVLVGGH